MRSTQADHHQPARIDVPGAEGLDRNGENLENAGREYGEADLLRAEAAHSA